MASKQTMEIVKATAPVLQEHGETITKVFYQLLFEKHPELKSVFNMQHQAKGSQQKVLANAIFQYAVHIDKLQELGDLVENIAQKHVSLSIPAAAYPIVGENLLEAIKIVLKEGATKEIIAAWAEAYEDLAAIFVQREETIYDQLAKEENGYRGPKNYILSKIVEESSVIRSFYLKREDGLNPPNFKPGQYVAISIEIPGKKDKYTRNYSLSDTPDKEYLRLSIKREEGNPDGIVSNYLHTNGKIGDIISLGIPAGNFILEEDEKPLVLISGGIGITPLLSMYKTAVKSTTRPITFIQCARNGEVHAFQNEIKEIKTSNVKTVVIYDQPTSKDRNEHNFDYEGILNHDILNDLKLNKNNAYYFCGPTPFMSNILGLLNDINVDNSDIHYEFFGPKEELELV